MNERIITLDGYTLNPGDLDWGPIQELGEHVCYDRTESDDLVVERMGDARVALTNKTPFPADLIERLPNLKYIGVLATGYNIIDLPAAAKHDITVTNVPGYSTDAVAQHVFALLLELTNRTAAHSDRAKPGWADCPDFSFTLGTIPELREKTIGIVGMGSIGKRVAQIAAAFGMRVLAAHQSSMNRVLLPNVDVQWLEHDDLFAASDVITLHCPLTDKTEKMVNARMLGKMKPSAYLINTGRGQLIDESALAAALKGGAIAGAGLDVLSSEPPAKDNPLLSASNSIVTPHIAWASFEARRRLMTMAAQNLEAWHNGSPINVVG